MTTSSNRTDRSHGGSLAMIFAVVFIDLLGFGIVLPLLPRYGEYYEAQGWVLGLLVASFSAMQFFFAPAWGRLSDRVGRRPILLGGRAGSIFSYGLFGWASSIEHDATWLGLGPISWLFISRIGAGIAGATISTAHAYISDVTRAENRAQGMALIGLAFGCGFTFGPILGSLFVSNDPTAAPSPYPGYLGAGLSAIAFLAAVFLLREPESHKARADRGTTIGRLAMLNHPARFALFMQIFITTGAFAMFESTVSLLSERLGYSDRENFYLFAFIGVTLMLAQGLLVRSLARRLREYRMAPIGIFVMAVALAIIAGLESLTSRVDAILLLALGLCVVGFAFVTPALQTLLSFSADRENQGAVLGLGQSANALSRIVGPIVGISLFKEYAAPLTYGLASATMLLSLLAIFPVMGILKRHRSQAENPEIAAAVASS